MKTGYRMKTTSRKDYLQRIFQRYRNAGSSEKGHILDEFCANCGYHRKYAIRLLNGAPPASKPVSRPRRRRKVSYGVQVISILEAVWEAADYPWSLRLKALLPQWMPWIRRRFRLRAEIEEQLLRISPRAIDYRLQSRKRVLRKRIYGNTKPGTLLKQHIPVKTDRWDVQVPGFTEIDLVSHSGASAGGDCCHSLNLTDIYSTWVETRAVLGKGQQGVRQALEEIGRALPFPLRGIDSDNGSEFINAHLYGYCRSRGIQFTRGRPYKKDDNAHIEQKNWTHVRRLLGYARYDSQRALVAINDLYANELHLFRNLFLPSVKLVRKVRVGSRTRRIYGKPQTPFERVCASPASDPEQIAALKRQQRWLDPFELSRAIQAKLEHIFQLSQELVVPGKPQTAILQNGSEHQIPRAAKKNMHKAVRKSRGQAKMKTRQSMKKPGPVASYAS
jgi:transposase InsO family protein